MKIIEVKTRENARDLAKSMYVKFRQNIDLIKDEIFDKGFFINQKGNSMLFHRLSTIDWNYIMESDGGLQVEKHFNLDEAEEIIYKNRLSISGQLANRGGIEIKNKDNMWCFDVGRNKRTFDIDESIRYITDEVLRRNGAVVINKGPYEILIMSNSFPFFVCSHHKEKSGEFSNSYKLMTIKRFHQLLRDHLEIGYKIYFNGRNFNKLEK